MEKHYCSSKLSKLAKQAGFDEERPERLGFEYTNTEFKTVGNFCLIAIPKLTDLHSPRKNH